MAAFTPHDTQRSTPRNSLEHERVHSDGKAESSITTILGHKSKTTSLNESSSENGSQDTSVCPDIEKQEVALGVAPDATASNLIDDRSKGKTALIMLALCLAVFLCALDVTIVTTALPTIAEHFQSSSGYTWIGSAFLLANAASIPSWGKISDVFGRKPMLLLANIIFMIGSLIAALSTSIGMLVAARAVQGLGTGGLSILTKIVISDIFPMRIRSAFYGVIAGVWAVASAAGPLLGGALTQAVSWRWCFYINLPLDGLAFFIIFFWLDVKTPRTPLIQGLRAIDWVGSMLVVSGTLLFLLGLELGGNSEPWKSARVICLLVFGIVCWGLFVLWELRYAKYPVMPMSVFRNISSAATIFCGFIQAIVCLSATYYLPLYFQSVRGATPVQSGLYVLPTAVAVSISSIVTGFIVTKTGMFRSPVWFGFFMMTLGSGLFIDLNASSSLAKLIIYQAVAGLGVGPLYQAPIIALQAHVKQHDISTATSTFGFLRQLALAIAVVIGQVVYQNQMRNSYVDLTAEGIPAPLAKDLASSSTSVEAAVINSLTTNQRDLFRNDLAASMRPMWLMYTCLSVAGLLASFLIRPKVLSSEHTETETGLDAERANAEARRRDLEKIKSEKQALGQLSLAQEVK